MFSPLANMKKRIPDGGRWNHRGTGVVGVLVHHNAGIDAYGQATAPGREVSANYWITNVGEILPNIPEELRAWTSGHPSYPEGAKADHRFITVEVSNSGGAPGWPISRAARSALARLIGDVHSRYGLGEVKRGTARGVAVHKDFVKTECPGPGMLSHLGEIIEWAETYRKTGATAPERDKDIPVNYISLDTNARKTKQTLEAKKPIVLQLTDGGSTAITSKDGDYELSAEVTVKGAVGQIVRLTAVRYIWDAKAKKYTSKVYLNKGQVVVADDGFGFVTLPVSNRTPKDGSRIGIEAELLAGPPVTVTRFAAKGHQWDRS